MQLTRTAVVLLLLASFAQAQVNGYEEYVQGLPVVHVWGTDTEMGYALGYLDGDRFYTIVNDIIIPSWGIAVWNQYRECYSTYFTAPSRMGSMVEGMLEGIADHPDSILYSPSLGRNFDELDMYCCHALTDISAVLYGNSNRSCTSLSAWDSATINDIVLQGSPALARNLDSQYHPLLAEMHCVITLDPDSGNRVVLYGQPMDLDCSTAMNEYGICVTRNAAYHDYITNYTPPFVPIGYSALSGLIADDFDGSGSNDLEDLLTALVTWNRAPSKNLHVAAPRSLGYMNEPAVVVEINNDSGYVYRLAGDDPVLGPEHMAATNHFRLLYPPDYCSRYDLLRDSISADPEMTLQRFWDLMGCCDITGWHTYLTVLFLPESRETGIAFCDSLQESWAKDPVWLNWEQLFPPEGIEGDVPQEGMALVLSPNPTPGKISVSFMLCEPVAVRIDIYDTSGRVVRSAEIPGLAEGAQSMSFDGLRRGVYLCRLEAGGSVLTGSFVVAGQ